MSKINKHATEDMITDNKYLNNKNLFGLTVLTAIVYYIYSKQSLGMYQHDEAAHYVSMRNFWIDPHSIFGNWAKPGYKFLTVIPSLLGNSFVTFFHCVLAAFTCFLSYKILEHYKSKFALLIFVILSLTPIWLNISFRNYAENAVAFFVVLAILLHVKKKYYYTALVVSYIAIVRQEYLVWAGLYFWVLLLNKKFLPILVLGVFPALFQLYGMVFKGDMIYLFHFYIGYANEIGGGEIYPYLGFDQFFNMSVHTFGAVALTLFICYLPGRLIVRKSPKYIILVPLLVMFFIYGLFNAKWFTYGPTAMNVRMLNALVPMVCLLAVLTLDDVLAISNFKRKLKYLFFIVPFAVVTGIYLSYTHNWLNITEVRDWKPLVFVILTSGLVLFMSKKKSLTTGLVVLNLIYTFAVIRPLKGGSEEVVMKELASWFNESTASGSNTLYRDSNKIYCTNSLFHYYAGLPSVGPKYKAVALKPIQNSKKGDLIIWDSHYANKKSNVGHLGDEYFSKNPKDFLFVRQFIADDKRFYAKVYKKLTDSDTTLNASIDLYLNKKYDTALLAIDKVLEKYPNKSQAHYYKGMCLIGVKKEKEAVNAFSQAITTDANNVSAYGERGKLLSKYGNHTQAIVDLNKFIATNNNDLEAIFYRGTSLLNTEKVDLAKKDFETVIKINAKTPGAYYNLGLAYVKSKDLTKACENFKKAKELGLAQAEGMITKHCK